tara:strand:+ start:112 stop:876 length:765 start_codon:yes stop_codon:yes gene_type:complete
MSMGLHDSTGSCIVVANLFLSTILLSGCTGLGGVGSEDLGLVVESDAGHAMIHSSFEDGSQTSVTYPSVTFDFSESTNYGQGTLFGVDPGDGSEPVTIDSSESTKISIEFANHGLYSVNAFGVDESGLRSDRFLEVIIEHRIDWYENNTGMPDNFVFDSTPGNDGPIPSHFLLNSTVENPSVIEIDGREVDVRWEIVNHEGVCQTATENVGNGDQTLWKTIHFGPLAVHEVRLTIEEGQDRINVHHALEIRYVG